MIGSLARAAAPNAQPVSLADVKAALRVDASDDDALIGRLIETAAGLVEGKASWCGRALVTQTWDYYLPRFPLVPDQPERDALLGIRLPLPPLQSVTSIAYVDAAGATQTLQATEYVVDTKAEPGRVVPAYGKSWPATRETVNAVTVRFIAGYGQAEAVPQEIRDWIGHAVGYFYLHREAAELPQSFLWSLARYRVEWGF